MGKKLSKSGRGLHGLPKLNHCRLSQDVSHFTFPTGSVCACQYFCIHVNLCVPCKDLFLVLCTF